MAQDQAQNEQDNSQNQVNSQTNSQQQFSRTIDPSSGNNAIGVIGSNNNSGTTAAEDKKQQANVNPAGKADQANKAEENNGADVGPAPSASTRNTYFWLF